MSPSFDLASRAKASAVHLGISCLVALFAATLVFGLWYPWPYREISGGKSLFLLMMAVDLVLGPLLTLVVFNRTKSRSHLIRDLAVIAVLQLAGLGYGLYTVYLARPVALVFEADRFRVVSNVDVRLEELPQAVPAFRSLSVAGPRIIGTRKPRNADEQFDAINLGMQGIDIGFRPSFWQPYADSVASALAKAKPVSVLYKKYPEHAKELDNAVAKTARTAANLKFLPLTSRQASWCALLDASTGDVLGFVPYDGFF